MSVPHDRIPFHHITKGGAHRNIELGGLRVGAQPTTTRIDGGAARSRRHPAGSGPMAYPGFSVYSVYSWIDSEVRTMKNTLLQHAPSPQASPPTRPCRRAAVGAPAPRPMLAAPPPRRWPPPPPPRPISGGASIRRARRA